MLLLSLCLKDSTDREFLVLSGRAFNSPVALMGLSTIIYRLVSSAKSLLQECISSTISLIYK